MFGKNFEGNQIAKILDNLDKLKDIIQEHLTDFHDTFAAIRDFKKAVCGTTLDPGFQSVIDKLEVAFHTIHTKFGSTIPKQGSYYDFTCARIHCPHQTFSWTNQ